MKLTEQQLKALAPSQRNRIISAQAGAGKTGVLVERIVNAIEDGIGLDQMLIVTFTKKAAGEMKRRIRLRLLERLEDAGSRRIYLLQQLNLVASANIQTMHAFCLEIIRQHFDRLDRDPSFTILTGRKLAQLAEQAMDETMERAYRGEIDGVASDQMDLFLRLFQDRNGRTDMVLRALIKGWSDRCRAAIDPDGWRRENITSINSPAFVKDLILRALDLLVRDVVVRMEGMLRAEALLLAPTLPEMFIDFIQDEIEALRHLCFGSFVSGDRARTRKQMEIEKLTEDNWTSLFEFWLAHGFRFDFARLPSVGEKKFGLEAVEQKERVKKLREAVRGEVRGLEALVSSLSMAEVQTQQDLLQEELLVLDRLSAYYLMQFAEAKREQDGIDFQDVEHLMLELLGEEDIVRSLKEQYALIFFDEYQDANELQEAIVETMARGDNLFFVGDVKQSIYGFRGAVPENFVRRYERYAASSVDEKIDLTLNFRSEPEILEFINRIFAPLMTPKRGGVLYDSPAHRAMSARASTGKGKVEIAVLAEPKPEHIVSSFDAMRPEVFYVAERIAKHVAAGGRYRDCAILSRKKATLSDFERVLQARNIPVFNSESQDQTERTELLVARHLLETVDNLRQDIPLLSSLLSLVGGFREEDLARIRIAHPNGPFYQAFESAAMEESTLEETLKERVRQFYAWRRKWLGRLKDMPLSLWMERLLTESGWMTALSGLDAGEERRRNIDMFLRLAEEFEARGGTSLHAFLSYAKETGNSEDTRPASPLSEEDDVVRLMTIHKSKGLQFKNVYLVGMDLAFPAGSTQQLLVEEGSLGCALPLRSMDEATGVVLTKGTLFERLIREQKRRKERAEEVRILYVAMTRAEEKLFLVGTRAEASAPRSLPLDQRLELGRSYFDWILPIMAENGTPVQPIEEPVDRSLAREEEPSTSQQGSDAQKIERILSYRYPFLSATMRPLKQTVSQLAKKNRILDAHFKDWPALSDTTQRTETTDYGLPLFMRKDEPADPATYGTLLHRALQMLPLRVYTKDELNEALDALEDRGDFTADEHAALDVELLLSFFASPLGTFVVQQRSHVFRERSFTLKLASTDPKSPDARMVDGQIDLFIDGDEGITLIDFKSDRDPDADRYKEQLKFYTMAVERAFEKPVVGVYLYWIRSRRAEKIGPNGSTESML